MVKKLKKIIKKPLSKGEDEKIKKTKIRVIGIGGGGGTIVSEIASRISKASFVVANTDLQALRSASKKAIRFQFGQNFTQGLGTGMNAELGEMAAQNEKEKIKKLLEGQDFCIIVACLGGGTSSGAAPIFAKISKNLGNITYGIFTLPFKFEGEKKMEMAKKALEKLKPKLNALSVIPNERIFQTIDKTTPLKQALSTINKSLADSLEGLIETIYQPGLINIDFADLKTILQGQGRLAYLNTVEVQKSDTSAKEAIDRVLNCPLYPYTIRGAKGVLFNIVGEKNLELSQVSQISKTISELTNKEAKIIFGISHTPHQRPGGRYPKYRGVIKTTLLATGCGTKFFPGKPRPTRQPGPKMISRPPQPTPPIEKQPPRPKQKLKVKKTKRIKPKKMKIEVSKEPEEKTVSPPAVEPKKTGASEMKVRKNALQIKREIEEAEEEMLKEEKKWETPAFLRRKKVF